MARVYTTFMPIDSDTETRTSLIKQSLLNECTVTLIDRHGRLIVFPCGLDEPVYKAAGRAGYELTLGCMQGRCRICSAKLISGEVKYLRSIPKEEVGKLSGSQDVLLCSYAPQVDTTLQTCSPWLQRT